MTFNCTDAMKAQPKSGAVVLSDDLKNPAMEKLDLVRKWSINTYKVILFVLDLFLCPSFMSLDICPILYLLSLRKLAEKSTIPQTGPHDIFSCFRLCIFAPLSLIVSFSLCSSLF